MSESSQQINRSQLVKATAWSAPVILAALEVPKAQASVFSSEITALIDVTAKDSDVHQVDDQPELGFTTIRGDVAYKGVAIYGGKAVNTREEAQEGNLIIQLNPSPPLNTNTPRLRTDEEGDFYFDVICGGLQDIGTLTVPNEQGRVLLTRVINCT